jgi:hypothetical protein
LKTLQSNQTTALEREQARLTNKYGANHPRVQQIAARLTYNQGLMRDLDREIERSQIQVPPFDLNTWLVHGRVLDQQRTGMQGLTVSLFNEQKQWIRQLGHACTDERGYFAIAYRVEGQRSQIPPSQPLFLTITNPNRQILHQENAPLFVKLGQIDYREIVLTETEVCHTPPESDTVCVPVEILSIDGPTELTVNQPGSFTATINTDATQPVTSQWNFGDTTSATGLTATHSYAHVGLYTVTFTAANRDSTDSASMTVRVQSMPVPATIARLSAAPMNPDICTPVRFSADVQGDESIAYTWNFGDNTTSTETNPSHTYRRPGSYTVALTVSNTAGSDSRSLTLMVSRPDPDAWVARGRVTDEMGQGIEGLVVSLYDRDLHFDDRLGTTCTDTNGDFAIAYRSEDFQDLFEASPDLYIKVMDRQGNLLYSSENTVRCEAGQVEVFNITISKREAR